MTMRRPTTRSAPHRRVSRALLLLLAATLWSLAGCSHNVSITPPSGHGDQGAAHAQDAQRALDRLAGAVDHHRPGQVAGLAGSAYPRLLGQILANARALGARDLSLRYVTTAQSVLPVAQQQRYGADAWVGSVDIGYRLPMDTSDTHMEIAVTFQPGGPAGARIAAIGGHGDRSALWLQGPVAVRRTARTTVIAAGSGASATATRFQRYAMHAIRDVTMVLPHWHGQLVFEVPPDSQTLDKVLASNPRTYGDIAAVTTSVDGSLVPGSPVHVFINPDVFDTLKPQGAQIVLSHESTHVATAAPFASMPTWLTEGFADYVALDHAGVPVRRAAGQFLAQVRRHGMPTRLPSASDLQPTANGLGATYEEAWSACWYLGRTYGQHAMVALYDAVHHGTSVPVAFRRTVGVSEQAFVAGWRRTMLRLAG